jgi:PIN domain nuclease of toxin-antitoxin system
MSEILLDTHFALWWLTGNTRKLGKAKEFIEKNHCWVSVASIWELRQKEKTGKLPLPLEDLKPLLEAQGFEVLDIKAEHVESAFGFNAMHDDMHDRLLVATAQCEGLQFLTRDGEILERAAPILGRRLLTF